MGVGRGGGVVMFELCDYILLSKQASFFSAQVRPPQQQNTPVIVYKCMRTKEIIYRGKHPSDIDSNTSAPDADLEGKDIMQEEESKSKRRRTGENEVNMRALSSFHRPFFLLRLDDHEFSKLCIMSCECVAT